MRYVDEYFEKIRENRYLTLVPTNESKEKNKKYKELLIKIRDSIKSITKNFEYDEKYIKINFNLDDELPLNKTVEISTITKVVRDVFLDNNKYYPHGVLDECLNK